MTTATMTKTDPDQIRRVSLRVTAKRRGLSLMTRRNAWWVLRGDEIVAGGTRGLSLDEVERLIREDGLTAATTA